MTPLTIFIFHHTDETLTLSNSNTDFSIEDCEEREMTFYSINAISKYIENGIEYGMIHANGSQYITTESYNSLKEIIKHII